jgi:hypothetical protein
VQQVASLAVVGELVLDFPDNIVVDPEFAL